jgi:hypothetical protein
MNHVRISVQAQAANRSRLPAAGQLLGIFVAAVLLVLPATATAQTPPAAPCRCASSRLPVLLSRRRHLC